MFPGFILCKLTAACSHFADGYEVRIIVFNPLRLSVVFLMNSLALCLKLPVHACNLWSQTMWCTAEPHGMPPTFPPPEKHGSIAIACSEVCSSDMLRRDGNTTYLWSGDNGTFEQMQVAV